MGANPQIAPMRTVDWQSVLSVAKDLVDEIEKKNRRTGGISRAGKAGKTEKSGKMNL